jgi:hypothetical protein
MPTTPEIEEQVEQVLEGRPASPEARRRIVEEFKLRFYFGGHPIVFRHTERGTEVLAVGDEEVRHLFRRRRSQAELSTLIYDHPDRW